MPLVRITLKKGTGPEFKQQISQSVHQSLVTKFNIPEEDRFQIIEEVDTENLIWPERYMGIPHSDQIIYVQITAKSGRSRAMKQALFRAIADEINRRTQHNTNDLVITLTENLEENWSFGNGEAQLVSGTEPLTSYLA